MPSAGPPCAVASRVAARTDELSRRIVERLRVEMVGYRLVDGEPEFEEAMRFATANVAVLLDGLGRERPEIPASLLDQTRLMAATLASRGVSLSAMQHAGRVWGATVWDAVLEAARRDRPAEREAALAISGRIWRQVDVVSTTAAHAYLDEVTDRGLLSRQLLDLLLSGRGDTELAQRLARRLHVRLGAAYVAVILRGDGVPVEDAAERPLATTVALDRIVEAARVHLRPGAGPLLLGIRLGDVVALYPVADPEEVRRVRRDCAALAAALSVGVSIGASGAHPGPEGLALAFGEAREAVEIAVATGVRGRAVALEEVLVDHLVRASAYAQRILDAALAPLREYDRAHRTELTATLAAYFDATMNVTRAARRLTVHPNTVVYRLRRIRELTGYDTGATDQLVTLYLALKLNDLRAV